ncbi:MAG: hypothetical protein ACJ8J0_11065 [Longimicrobiaceae bacterium]|jgi:hypothetical protein
MKRLALATLLAAALAAACGRSPAAPESARAPAGASHDGYLGSGNRHDSTHVTPP